MEGFDEPTRVSVHVEWGIPVNYGLMIFFFRTNRSNTTFDVRTVRLSEILA